MRAIASPVAWLRGERFSVHTHTPPRAASARLEVIERVFGVEPDQGQADHQANDAAALCWSARQEGPPKLFRNIINHPVHAVIGALVGQVVLPVPIVGAFIGAQVGGHIGHVQAQERRRGDD